MLIIAVLTFGVSQGFAQMQTAIQQIPNYGNVKQLKAKRITDAERKAAAVRAAAVSAASPARISAMPMPGGTPDYFGSANWAFSPPLKKFVDTLPGLNTPNNLGQMISVAVPDTVTYPGSDYYEISVRQYTEQMHSGLPPTTLRGYVQTNLGTDGDGNNTIAPAPIHYLGPLIIAKKNRPVRIKFTNELPMGADGDLFIPVDTTIMGAGMGPLGMDAMPMNYTQNRATLHLHGGKSPWISDGTPHQWITPMGEMTPYPKGVSVQNVPDMPDPGDGSLTFYYTNQQSSRLMFYHDHSWGITRLNVYVGGAAGYIITDETELELINSGIIPAEQIPLIIQDKTFVDAAVIRDTDPTWNWGTGAPDLAGIRPPITGDLWYPHVYSPAQNPYDIEGVNAFGRWHYGPWFWPPTTGIPYGPVPNPYYDPANPELEPPEIPGVPHPSMPGESFMDTALVNGTAFPTLTVEPKAYRFRILNASNDRFWNLQLYVADPTTVSSDGRTQTEVKMVPAALTPGFPESWPTDGREGGVPDPATAGPSFIQIGTEGGFLPAPAVIPNQPIAWNMDPTTFNFGNVSDHALLVGTAERADVIIDFSGYAGQTLILYNDAPAAFPALDARYDYYTGAPDLTANGGHPGPQIGFGPNTRTIMQIKVAPNDPAPTFGLDALQAAFASTATTPGVFARSQDPIIVGQTAYNSAYNTVFPRFWPYWGYARIQDNSMSFKTVAGDALTIPLEPKALQDEMGEAFDEYGRMSGKLGLELPFTQAGNQNFVLQNYVDPTTEILVDCVATGSPVAGDGTQLWKLTHNGVDTHTIHFHLFDVQLINRVGWDGAIRLPDANELGWKDTIRVSPLEDTIVALRPVSPKQPFGIPDSIRPWNPMEPIGSTMGFTNINPFTGQPIVPPITNQLVNFGWEYVWHCHILSHEEMDMMRPMAFNVARMPATAPVLNGTLAGTQVDLTWTDDTSPTDPATLGNPANEIGFRIERAVYVDGTPGPYMQVGSALANATSYTDAAVDPTMTYDYRVVAFNAAGDSPSDAITLGPPAPPPSAPTNLSAALQAGLQVGLTWTDNALDETGFVVEVSVNGGPFAEIGTVGPLAGTGIVNYTHAGVSPGNTYTYQVKAMNGVVSSDYSNTASVTVPSLPAAPSNLTASAVRGLLYDLVTLRWVDNANNETGFTIQRSRNATFTSNVVTINVLPNVRAYTQTFVPRLTTFYYRIRANNAIGSSAWSNVFRITTP